MITFLFFSIKRAWEGFWRNALMSLAATATMVLMLILLAGFWQAEQWYEQCIRRSPAHARPRRLRHCMAGGQLGQIADLLGMPVEPMVVSNACATGATAPPCGHNARSAALSERSASA